MAPVHPGAVAFRIPNQASLSWNWSQNPAFCLDLMLWVMSLLIDAALVTKCLVVLQGRES
jgi:hypothetical protein